MAMSLVGRSDFRDLRITLDRSSAICPIAVTNGTPENLANCAWQVRPKFYRPWGLYAAQSRAAGGDDLVRGKRTSGEQLHHSLDSLTPLLVRHPHHRAVLHARQGQDHLLDFRGIDVETARDDQVPLPVDEGKRPANTP